MAKGTNRDPLVFATLDEAKAALAGAFAWVRVGNDLYRILPNGKVFPMGSVNG